jgi:LmbE family N-acetylglucosaminyl deacetylase
MGRKSHLTVISPHLDDAAFSCATLLEGATVVTICAGVPSEGTPPTQFDVRAGFADGHEAMTERRKEDQVAAAIAGFHPVHLNHLDVMYGVTDYSAAIEEALEYVDGGPVYGPLGLRHPDHQAISFAFRYWARQKKIDAWLYAELPYFYTSAPHVVPAFRIAHPSGPTILRPSPESKRALLNAYASQIRGAHIDEIMSMEVVCRL